MKRAPLWAPLPSIHSNGVVYQSRHTGVGPTFSGRLIGCASLDRNPLFATGSPRPGGRLPIARGPSVELGPPLNRLEEIFPLVPPQLVDDPFDVFGALLRAYEECIGGVDHDQSLNAD